MQVDDLQLELDASMIRLMHRKLDIDCDGFINRQVWHFLNTVESSFALFPHAYFLAFHDSAARMLLYFSVCVFGVHTGMDQGSQSSPIRRHADAFASPSARPCARNAQS